MNCVIKLLLSGILFFSTAYSLFGQEEQILREERYVYFNAGALLNLPSGLQFGIEQKVARNIYWDFEGGILLFSKTPTIVDFNAMNRKGYRNPDRR